MKIKTLTICVIFIVFLLSFLPCSESAQNGKIITVQIPAPSLVSNKFGEPIKEPAVIYLPPSYDNVKKFPVVYFLPGFATPLIAYTSGYFQGFLPRESIDVLVKENKIKEMIVVFLNGMNKLGGCFYVNSLATGNWEDFIVKDAVGYIDQNYKTLDNPASRGISGQSMGGFGALNIAMHHPEVFSAVYATSPGLFDENGAYDALKQWQSESPNICKAYGAAFSPNLNLECPFAEIPSVKDDNSFKNWQKGFGNLKEKISGYRANLLQLRGLYFDVGTNDEYPWIVRGARYFSKELDAAGVPHTFMEFDGTHTNKTKDRFENHLLPFFSENFNF